jgi:hypothetical protein
MLTPCVDVDLWAVPLARPFSIEDFHFGGGGPPKNSANLCLSIHIDDGLTFRIMKRSFRIGDTL